LVPDGLVSDGSGGVDADGEAKLVAEGFEAVDAGLGLVAETEVFAFVQLGDVQGLLQDLGGEDAGGHVREFDGEGQDEDSVDTGCGEEFELLHERGDEGLAGFGADDAGRVRVEGDGDGDEAEGAGAGDDLGDDPLVAAMHTVEVADGGDRRAEVCGDFCELAVYLHQAISKLICRPS